MKQKLFLLAMLIVFATNGFSQIEVKFNPIGALFGQIPLSTEYILNDNMGIEATLGYYYKKTGDFQDVSKSSGLVTSGLFKYYFSPDKGGDKFYAFPYVRYVTRSFTFNDATYGDIEASYSAFGVGFGLGYKWVADSGILLDFGFGAGKNFTSDYSYSDPNYSSDVSIPGINFLGRISVGYRF
jgi:hypothetical protein